MRSAASRPRRAPPAVTPMWASLTAQRHSSPKSANTLLNVHSRTYAVQAAEEPPTPEKPMAGIVGPARPWRRQPRSLATGPAIGSPDQRGRSRMRRREFIAGLGAAVAWPLPARAQRPQPMRRVGILWPYTETDPDSQSRITSLQRALQDLGWTQGTNVRPPDLIDFAMTPNRRLSAVRCQET